MGKNKLKKFAEMKTLDCVFEPDIETIKQQTFPLKAQWRQNYFENELPIVLELGCGKGEYTVQLAQAYPQANYIGIDIKGARMWKGAKIVENEGIKNAAFLRTRIDFIEQFFGEDEVDEIWLTFSDPQPKKPNKRLSAKPFIDRYKKILKNDGVIHVKTDSTILYEFTLEEIQKHKYRLVNHVDDIYEKMQQLNENLRYKLSIATHYEKMFAEKGHRITYCAFQP